MKDMVTKLKISELWAYTLGSKKITIAILDGPVDICHPSLRNSSLIQVDGKKNPTSVGYASMHGTHIASIIFGQHGEHLKGIAPVCHGIVIPIFNDTDPSEIPTCSQRKLATAIEMALDADANIINISAGHFSKNNYIDPHLIKAVDKCVEKGVLIVSAAGNEYNQSMMHIPASMPDVLAVGIVDRPHINRSHRFSTADLNGENFILATGEGIVGAALDGTFSSMSGSSCSTAIVSGICALLMSIQIKIMGKINAYKIKEILLKSASLSGTKHKQPRIINIRGALDILNGAAPILDNKEETNSYPIKPEWKLSSEILLEKYDGIPLDRFGTVDVVSSISGTYQVQDLHYKVTGEKTGMDFIPVSDYKPIILSDGTMLPGYQLVDGWLRKCMKLTENEKIFALLSYVKIQELSLPFLDLPLSKLKHSHQHLGAYQGKGVTTHALPPDAEWKGNSLLNMQWNADRYPINIHTISLNRVPQNILNRNACIVDTILTNSVKVPVNTELLSCRVNDINTTFQYYRDTILEADYLSDISWYVNCSEHKTIVINVMVNLPHNEKRFIELFGEQGKEIWKLFKFRYKKITGEEFRKIDETEFKPLWGLEGFRKEKVQPLTIKDYHKYYSSWKENRLEGYSGSRPLQPGKGMAWTMETALDVLEEFLEVYIDFEKISKEEIVSMIIILRHNVTDKTGITEKKYLELVVPVIIDILFSTDECLDGSEVGKFDVIESVLTSVIKYDKSVSIETNSIVENILHEEFENGSRNKIKNNIKTDKINNLSVKKHINKMFNYIRCKLKNSAKLNYFSTPSIMHKLAEGIHPKSEHVQVRAMCTAMDVDELDQNVIINHEYNCNAGNDWNVFLSQVLSTQSTKIREVAKMANQELEAADISEENTEELLTQKNESDTLSCGGEAYLVYAFGKIEHSFLTLSRKESIKQQMGDGQDPDDPIAILEYLNDHPYESSSIQWALVLDGTPIYALEPVGPFARETFEQLRQFYYEQTVEGVERVSIPGYVIGANVLDSGDSIPIIAPEIRGMFSWTTNALVDAVCGEPPSGEKKNRSAFNAKKEGVRNFLDRVYYEMRNLGKKPSERALNFAATNAFQVERVYETALKDEMELEAFEVEQGPLTRPGSDYWDVKLLFFYPLHEARKTKKVFRFTVDVSDVVPVVVGQVRFWATPS